MKLVTKQTYAFFWKHLRHYRWAVILSVIVSILGTFADLGKPLLYKQFFDELTTVPSGGDDIVGRLTFILILITGVAGLRWIFFRACHFLNNYYSARIMADIPNECFDYLHNHSFGFFLNRFVGSLVRKVSRLVDAFENIADRFYWDLFPTALKVILIVAIFFERHTILGVIILAWILFYVGISYAFALYKFRYDTQVAEADSATSAYLSDTITNNANLKLFTALRDEARAFRSLTNGQYKLRIFSWNLSAYFEALQAALILVLEFAIFYYAIRFWNQGLLTVGDLVLFQTYLLKTFDMLWGLGRVIRQVYKHLADAHEMIEILHAPHEVTDAPRARTLKVKNGKFSFKDIFFAYPNGREIIRHFSLEVRPGEKVGIVGPSGAGKSTLIALFHRFYDIQKGAILIDDQNIAQVTQESLRRHIALVPQDTLLFHRTLLENIRYGRRTASDKEVFAAARLAHCDDFVKELPDGYATYVGERGIKLSGGERQRVAIARAILKNAPILVLDEATSSLDSHSELLIQDALYKLMEGKTTVVIAHRLSTIMRMDRIVVVEHGTIVEAGTHQELLNKPDGLYKKLWDLQVGGFIL